MRVNFRQGIISHQTNFLTISGSGGSPVNIDLNTNVRPTTITIAHVDRNYLFSEINPVDAAWTVPSTGSRWLYWDFNPLTFERSFGVTDKEPIQQEVEPGYGDAQIVSITPGAAGVGSFTIEGSYSFRPGRTLVVSDTANSDGSYTVASSSYDFVTGDTTVVMNEAVTTESGSPLVVGSPEGYLGLLQTDLDSEGQAQLVVGRHWFDTLNNRHYVRVGAGVTGTAWAEVLRVFAARITDSSIFPMSINLGSFIGTQISDTTSVLAGRILFDEQQDPIIRDNGTLLTTEDQFFTAGARIDAVRLESNVARARFPGLQSGSAVGAYSVVAWYESGNARLAEYDDIGNAVVGILTEDVQANEEGVVIIQGIIRNTEWEANDWAINAPLWVNDEGLLTDVDPHTTDVSQHPVGRVPVARVLDVDTIVFEQGLGGKGDRGPQGVAGNTDAATTLAIGAVRLSTASSNPDDPIAISDTDPRLSDAREPLEHTHAAADITYTSNGCLSSGNVQDALTELCTEKVDVAGDTMEGYLTLSANPTAELHAATKQYVDGLVSGFIWLDPVCTINLIGDDVIDPSTIAGAVQDGDTYVVPSNAVGDWAALTYKNLVQWNENTNMWVDLGAPSSFSERRFGISFTSSTPASGSFASLDNQIALFDASSNFIGVEENVGSPTYIPQVNNAVFVCAENDRFGFQQYIFDGAEWNQFGGLTINTTTAIESLSDTDFSGSPTLTSGDVLVWNGTEWVNAPQSTLVTAGGGGGSSYQIIDADSDTFVRTEETNGGDQDTIEMLTGLAAGYTYDLGAAITLGQSGITMNTPGSDGATDLSGGDLSISLGSGRGEFLPSFPNSGGSFSLLAGQGTNEANGGAITIRSGRATGTGDAGSVTIETRDNDGTGAGGDINIITGQGQTNGGNINITLGTGAGGGPAGNLTVTSGQGTPSSGAFSFTSASHDFDGQPQSGGFTVTTGDAYIQPGNITLKAGNVPGVGSGKGGNVDLRPGDSPNVGSPVGDGHGAVRIGPLTTGVGEPTGALRFYDSAGTGDGFDSDYVGFKAPEVVSNGDGSGNGIKTIWTLPGGDGSNGQALTTNGAGQLGWGSGGGELPHPYDVAAQMYGTVPNGALIFKYVSSRSFLLFDFGHQGDFEIVGTGLPVDTPDSTTTFLVYKNGVLIGEIGFFEKSGSPPVAGISVDFGNGWPNGDGNYLGSFVSVDVGDIIEVVSPIGANSAMETVALTMRGVIEPVTSDGSSSVSFDNNATSNDVYTSAIGMTYSSTLNHAEWAVVGYVPAADWPPVGSPTTSNIIPMGDDARNLGSPGGNPSLTFNVPGVGATVFTSNTEYVATTNVADAPTYVSFDDGGYDAYYLIRCTVFGTGGVATDVAWVRPGQ